MANELAFIAAVLNWTEKAKKAPLLVIQETIQIINNRIVETTRVDTGFLRGSYFASINEPPEGEGSIGRDSSAINAVAFDLKPGDTYYMGNTAVYARRVEYGFVGKDSLGRSYNQQGAYTITAVIAQASSIFNEAAEKVLAGEASE